MWFDLSLLPMPVCLVAGAHDAKFVTINRHIARVMSSKGRCVHLHVVEGSGHAIHVEQPLLLLHILASIAGSNNGAG